jgi:peptidoglycan/xylan/chitin deacetylase (PgdA/CDA1 family)
VAQNSFLLTFDDGLREFHDVIAPILLRKGIPAICFLNSGFVDNKELFFRYKASILIENLIVNKRLDSHIKDWFSKNQLDIDTQFSSLLSINYSQRTKLDELAKLINVDFDKYLLTEKPYLDSTQIKSLINQGFVFGAHSVDHPKYADLTLAEQIRQTEQSIADLESKFQFKERLFSFPFTDTGVTTEFFEQVLEGDNPIADFTFGCSGLKNDSVRRNIQRIPIEISNFAADDIVYGEYLYFILKAFLGKNTIIRT